MPESVVGLGIDVVALERVAKDHERLAERILGSAELVLYAASTRPAEFLAGRFAAKEAVLKALGTGLSEGISWKEVEILRSPEGAPVAALRGKAADRLHALGASRALVSISHDAGLAVAVAQIAR